MKIAAAAYPLTEFATFADYSAKMESWVENAANLGAKLLVFPEYGAMELASLGGKAVAQDIEAALFEVAHHYPAVQALHCALAARFGVYILGASGPAFDGARPVNRAVFYGPAGVIGFQDKQIMTRFERETWHVVPGPGLKVFDTELGRIGIIICYDSEFPLLARSMVEAGAEILLAPSCTTTLAGFNRVRVGSMARALENQCVVVHSPLIGEAAVCPAVDMGTGAASIYGPPDLGFPPNGIIAETALNQTGWAVAEVTTNAIHRVRRDGRVLNLAHWPEQIDRLAQPVQLVVAQKTP